MASFPVLVPAPKPPDIHIRSEEGALTSKSPGTLPTFGNHPTSGNSNPTFAKVTAQNPGVHPLGRDDGVVRSFAAALNDGRPIFRPRFPAIPLPTRQVTSKDGRPAISFTGAEVNACEKRFEYSLVAKFTVGRPNISEIQKAFQNAWRISGRASISPIWDARHVLIILDSEADARVALSSMLNKVGHAFFRLFRWRPDYNPKKESKYATVWVKLPDIPLSIYDSSFIGAIVSTFGYFIDVDERTKACAAVQFARACVELDVTVPIPDSIWISLPNGKGYWQSIVIDSKMAYCNKCRVHGHTISTCRKIKPGNKSQDIQGHREKEGQSKNNGDVLEVNQTGKDRSVVTANPTKVAEDEPWQKVTYKKNSHKAARGVYVQKEHISGPVNVVSEANKSILDMGVKEPTLNLESQGDHDSTPIKDTTDIQGEDSGSYVHPSEPGGEEENSLPIVVPQESHNSAEVYYSEILQSHVHPDGEDHYLNIMNKIGSASNNSGDVSYITKRSKNKDNKGGKHCPSPPSK